MARLFIQTVELNIRNDISCKNSKFFIFLTTELTNAFKHVKRTKRKANMKFLTRFIAKTTLHLKICTNPRQLLQLSVCGSALHQICDIITYCPENILQGFLNMELQTLYQVAEE